MDIAGRTFIGCLVALLIVPHVGADSAVHRTHSADMELIATEQDEVLDAIARYIESVGGHLVVNGESVLVTRVPASRFDEAIRHIEGLGDGTVRPTERVTAEVADQLHATEWDLYVARAAEETLRSRRERDSDQVRRLDTEIRRLTDDLDAIGELTRFSRIAIGVRSSADSADADHPSPWIAALRPFTVSIGAATAPIYVDLPRTFAVFEDGHRWHAEDASGIRIRVGGVEEPEGDIFYWRRALVRHLASIYSWYSEIDAGEFSGVMLFNGHGGGFVYIVAVAVAGSELVVFEAVVPETERTERDLAFIERVLSDIYP